MRMQMDQTANEFVEPVVQLLSTWGLSVLGAIAVLAIGRIIAGMLRRATVRALGRSKVDAIVVAGQSGTVREVGIFTTVLATPDNVKIIVPNSEIYGATIANYSAYDTRRNDLVIGVSYADDLGAAEAVIRRVLDADSRVLADPTPQIAVSELGDSSVNFVVRPWCNAPDYWALRFDLLRRLKEELEAAGCSIPFPQRDVHLYRDAS